MAILTTDFDASAAYLSVRTTTPVDRTITTTVNVDLDERGEIVGIEFLTWPLEHVYAVGDWVTAVFPTDPPWDGQLCQITDDESPIGYGYRVRRHVDGVFGRLYPTELIPAAKPEPERGICHVCAGSMFLGEELWVHDYVHGHPYHAATPTRPEPPCDSYWWLEGELYQAGAGTFNPVLYRITRGKPFLSVKWENAYGAVRVEEPHD
jgi:hypothetical protein